LSGNDEGAGQGGGYYAFSVMGRKDSSLPQILRCAQDDKGAYEEDLKLYAFLLASQPKPSEIVERQG